MAVDPALLAAQQQVQAAWIQTWASVAQAFLSVGAIGVAMWIAKSDRIAEAEVRRAARRAEALDLVMKHRASFKAWGLHLDSRKEIASKGRMGAVNLAQLMHGDSNLLQPPQELELLRGELRRFGDAAPAIQRAFLAGDELKSLIPTANKICFAVALGTPHDDDLDKLLDGCKRAMQAIDEVLREVELLLGQKV